MAKAKKIDDTDARDTRIKELEAKVERLQEEIGELESAAEDNVAGCDLEALRDQLESLATDVDRPSAPQTPEQWSRCLKELLAGNDWESMTWR